MSAISPLTAPLGAPAKPQSAQLTEVSQQFEAIFVRQILAEARKAHFGGEEQLAGAGMDTFRQMQDERFADIAAERGSFGLAKLIAAQIGAGLGSTTYPAHAELVEAHAQPLPKEP